MPQLRQLIDALDRELVQLLTRRAACIDRAAQLKSQVGLPARIPERVEQVAENARRNAASAGLDPDFAENLWRSMMEWAIAREEGVLGRSPGSNGKDRT